MSESFGERLKALRAGAGMTQADLAERSGVPLGTIRDYEQVKRAPLLPTAIRLARALGTSVAVFEDTVEGEPPKSPRGRPRTGQGEGQGTIARKPARGSQAGSSTKPGARATPSSKRTARASPRGKKGTAGGKGGR